MVETSDEERAWKLEQWLLAQWPSSTEPTKPKEASSTPEMALNIQSLPLSSGSL